MLTTELNPNELDLNGINVIVIGEMHGSKSDYEFQARLINRYEPDIILNELAINLVLDNMNKKKFYLEKVKKDEDIDECFPMYPGYDMLDLLVNHIKKDIPCIGIDYTPGWKGINGQTMLEIFRENKHTGIYKESFEIRESRMINVINQNVNKYKKVVIVVGDTHLRTIRTKELGDISPIYRKFKNWKNALIIRSKTREIE